MFDKKVAYWKTLPTDKGASFDKEYFFDAADIEPMVTYGTNPGMGIKINDSIAMPKIITRILRKFKLIIGLVGGSFILLFFIVLKFMQG